MTKSEMKYFVTYYAPGSFVANTWSKEFPEQPEPRKVEWPDNAYAFTITKREDLIDDAGKRFCGDVEKIGPMYYHPASKVETLDELRRNPNSTEILIGNFERNHWTHCIWTRWGNWPQRTAPELHEVLN